MMSIENKFLKLKVCERNEDQSIIAFPTERGLGIQTSIDWLINDAHVTTIFEENIASGSLYVLHYARFYSFWVFIHNQLIINL